MTKISIITPNYNYSHFIGQTIESVINQNYANYEHIIVDDGSTDNSVDIIEKYVNKFPENIKLFKQKNQGQSVALNNALTHAKGDIIGWINSDDFYVENIFHKISNYFRTHPDVDVVYADYNIVDLNGKLIRSKFNGNFKYMTAVFAGFANILTSNTVFWRSDCMSNGLHFDKDLICNMDGVFFSELTFGKKVEHLDLVVANFRQQPVSLAGKNQRNWNEIIKTEREIEFKHSYKNLAINRYIDFRLGKYLIYPILASRLIIKNYEKIKNHFTPKI